LQEVAQKLKQNAHLSRSEVWVVYVNPLHLETFEKLGFSVIHSIRHRKNTLAVIAHWNPEEP
jgi:hypothetical protein